MSDVVALAPGRLELGEGGRRVGDRLVFVDIPAGRLLSAPAPAGTPEPPGEPLTELARLPQPLAAVAPVRRTRVRRSGRAQHFPGGPLAAGEGALDGRAVAVVASHEQAVAECHGLA